MAHYNGMVQSFVSGATTFAVSAANGVWVHKGDAAGPGMVERMVVTGTGAIHDLDGTAAAAQVPRTFWQEFVFQGGHPAAHTQYNYLLSLVGKHGTLTLALPGASSTTTTTVTARLRPLEGSWDAPYAQGAVNQLVIRATWQLKALL